MYSCTLSFLFDNPSSYLAKTWNWNLKESKDKWACNNGIVEISFE